jgi:biotin transport system substrate-specific component
LLTSNNRKVNNGDLVEITISAYKQARYNLFKWRYESVFVYKVALAFAFAGLTGLGAQLRIYLPFTPVPITGQVFLVLLSAVLLGKWYGGLSQALYAGIGGAGVPWFAPKVGMPVFSSGGWAVLTGATGGYILGFIIAAFIIGWFVDNFIRARSTSFLIPLLLSGVAIIYLSGALWIALLMGTGFQKTIAIAVLPFIPGDIIKAFAIVLVATALLPKETYNGEMDVDEKAPKKRWINSVGFLGSGLLTIFFAILFWLKLLNLGEVTTLAFFIQTFWYSSSILISGLLTLHFLKEAIRYRC